MIGMDALRAICESLGLTDVHTYIQSGNVVCTVDARRLKTVSTRMENAIEQQFGFRPRVILRSSADMKKVLDGNPFAERHDIDPRKLAVFFLDGEPDPSACEKVRSLKCEPDEVHIDGRQIYVYFPNGLGRPTLPPGALEKTLKVAGTARNWNTVVKLTELVEQLES